MTGSKPQKVHECSAAPIDEHVNGFYGEAFTDIAYDEDSGAWHAHNNEYTTPIRFCPWCGIKLQKK